MNLNNNISDDYIFKSDFKYIETAECIEDYHKHIAKCNIGCLMPLVNKDRAIDNEYFLSTSNIVNEVKPVLYTYTKSNYVKFNMDSKEGKKGETFNIAFISGDINNIKKI